MAGSLNEVKLIGRLTRDPVVREISNDRKVCQFSLATNRYGRDEAGNPKEFTDYHQVVVWNSGQRKLADLCGQYLRKGHLVYIGGRLQTRSWDDSKTGTKRWSTEVVANDVQFLESKNKETVAGLTPKQVDEASNYDPDDIPF